MSVGAQCAVAQGDAAGWVMGVWVNEVQATRLQTASVQVSTLPQAASWPAVADIVLRRPDLVTGAKKHLDLSKQSK